MRISLFIAALLASPTVLADNLPALSELASDGARITALVVDLSTHETLAKLNPRMRLTPASVTKLYVAAATLRRWGPHHRFTTRLLTGGSVRNGVLHGDLIFLGAGDPDFDTARAWRLIAQLRQRGITRITGNLIINQSLFGDVDCFIKDRCAAHAHSWHAYDAPLSSAGVNFSTVAVTVFPGQAASEPARIALMPPNMRGFRIGGSVETVPPGGQTSIWASRTRIPGGNLIRVSGQIALHHDPWTVYLSVTRPARYTGHVLRAIANMSGIVIEGELRVTSQPPDPALKTVAAVVSPLLANQLRDMLVYSNNYMADTLTLDLAAYSDSPPAKPLSLRRAARQLEQLAHHANTRIDWLRPVPAEATALAIDSGSGLSVSNKLAASDIVSLLAFMHANDALFATYAGLLPVMKFAVGGRLAADDSDWATRVAAKTGTLTEPVSVFGFAGYLRLQDGSYGAFAVLVNGRDPDNPIPTRVAIDAIQHDIEALLARH